MLFTHLSLVNCLRSIQTVWRKYKSTATRVLNVVFTWGKFFQMLDLPGGGLAEVETSLLLVAQVLHPHWPENSPKARHLSPILRE